MTISDGYLSDDACYYQAQATQERARARYRKRPEQAGYDNARFWWWNKGWVKITLKPGQYLNHYQFRSTDEGWSSQTYAFSHGGPRVVIAAVNSGRDCDGRLDHYATFHASLDNLRARFPGNDEENRLGELVPEWEETDSSQRDYQAEAAGY